MIESRFQEFHKNSVKKIRFMDRPRTILITGAAGNLGTKLRQHLNGRYPLRLLDINPLCDPAIIRADISCWDKYWVEHFQNVDTVVHLAADPTAHQTWEKLIGPNIDALINVFQASAKMKVRRLIYASSNHVMGGYKDRAEPFKLTTDLPPLPGANYVVDGEKRDSTAYASAKLFGERLGQGFADTYGISVVAVRIGWVKVGANRPQDIPSERGSWFKLMWLSNRDYCQLMEKCIVADPTIQFAVINGMSANSGMRWDIEHTKKLIGYEPLDDVTQPELT
jgi:nucleoside-diphosphate-sugar epimerase